jgi:hypothetical protein
MVKSWNEILFAETQNAKKPSLSIGMRRSTTSTEFNSFLFSTLNDDVDSAAFRIQQL